MMRLLHAPLVTHSLAAAAELGVADVLADGPRTVEELATLVGAEPGPLYRMLRTLASAGVFRQVAPRVFGTTPLADKLRADDEGSLRNWARLWGLPERQAAVAGLLHSVRTGRPAFEDLHGTTWWAHLKAHPAQAAVFGAAMGELARHLHAAAMESYDLSGVRVLVDVGGGEGHLVAAVLERYPAMSAIVHDRPEVVRDTVALLAAAGIAGRARAVPGDFFRAVPKGGDAYLLSMILHDWNDDQCVALLRNVRRVLPPGGLVLVIDAVVPEDDAPHDGKLRDILMLALHPGRERSEAEFAALFARAGLRHLETRAVSASTGLLVAVRDGAGQEDPRR
ncbi:methyltransferase [Actinomadura sp. 9N407]|uniref:methyltransferase n=1 Tax=Actinomadura sp. 9N407 TaxID=3375154 RepID=UPI0037932C11